MQAGCSKYLACEDLEIELRTVQRWLRSPQGDQRRGPLKAPSNKLSDVERMRVIEVSNSKDYQDLSPCQIVPMLASEGLYLASESTFYRLLKEQGMLAHRGKARPSVHKKPEPLVATAPNQVYSWDITYLMSEVRGQYYYLYMVEDVFSRAIVGWEVHAKEDAILAAELIDKIAKQAGVSKGELRLHSDNGSPMKGATMLSTLQRLGVIPSFSRPRVSDDNPYSESLFKTLKYCPKYPQKPFASLERARAWVKDFVQWYNHQHLHSGIKFITPMDRHTGRDIQILTKRKQTYEAARMKNPERFANGIRNWSRPEKVELNPLQPKTRKDMTKAS